MNKNNKLALIIESGKKFIANQEYPNNLDKVKIKMDILHFCAEKKNIFVTSKEFNFWKDTIKLDEENEEIPDWILSPLQIFTYDKVEFTKSICDYLFEKKYKYIRAKNDLYPQRFTLEVEFDIIAFIQENNSYLEKHLTYQNIYGSKFNTNNILILPIIYYEYITPKFNFETWTDNIKYEEEIWKNKNFNKETELNLKNSKNTSQKLLKIILNENENDYLFSGAYSYYNLLDKEYNGPITIYHIEPIEFLNKLNQEIDDLEVKNEDAIYYFYNKKYFVYNKNGDLILELYDFEFGFNYIRLGLENHTNYHGIILSLLINYLESDKKKSKLYENMIMSIFHSKELFLKKNKIDSCLKKSKYQVFQDKIIGKNQTPFLRFKKLEWNKELDFFYRPDKKEETENKEENNSTS